MGDKPDPGQGDLTGLATKAPCLSQLSLVQALITLISFPQTTVVVEAGVEGTAMAPVGHPTTQALMGVTAEVLGAALHTKANKVGPDSKGQQREGCVHSCMHIGRLPLLLSPSKYI